MPTLCSAIVDGSADQPVPPGGDDTVRRLAELLGREIIPLAEPASAGRWHHRRAACIGCTRCREACPAITIVGAHLLMHTSSNPRHRLRALHRALPGRLHQHEAPMSAPTYDLGKLHGGLGSGKRGFDRDPIQDIPIPETARTTDRAARGEPAQPIVGIGERVLKGQLIADPMAPRRAMHASSSGKIVAIEPWPSPAPRRSRAVHRYRNGWRGSRTNAPIRHRPTTLPRGRRDDPAGRHRGPGWRRVPNGAETAANTCESTIAPQRRGRRTAISCDDVLMRERARGYQRRADPDVPHSDWRSPTSSRATSRRHCRTGRCAQRDRRRAHRAQTVPTIYPSGGETNSCSWSRIARCRAAVCRRLGCLVQNVGMGGAIHDWIENHEPLISRVTTTTALRGR